MHFISSKLYKFFLDSRLFKVNYNKLKIFITKFSKTYHELKNYTALEQA